MVMWKKMNMLIVIFNAVLKIVQMLNNLVVSIKIFFKRKKILTNKNKKTDSYVEECRGL